MPSSTAVAAFKDAAYTIGVALWPSGVQVSYGHPGVTQLDDIVAFMDVSASQEPATFGTNRCREETLELKVMFSCFRAGGPDMEKNIFEELESPRGIGLACNTLGYIFRKQGEGWKSAQSTPSEAIFCFQQSIKHLERAEKVFSDEVSEPIRLWESLNEQGSLYRERGLLERGHQEVEKTQELYGKAVECQLKALEIAKKYRMRFQEADAYDDLAKVLWDQGNAKKAQRWLKRALSLVPKEFSASSNRKSKKSPPAGGILANFGQDTFTGRDMGDQIPYQREIIQKKVLGVYSVCNPQLCPGRALL